MKALNNIKIKLLVLTIIAAFTPAICSAQKDYKQYYVNGDWQFNVPISNSFANTASGWGMNFEGGYFFAPKMGIGLFMSYSTNHKYVDTQTMPIGDNGSLTTNQQRSLFQLPFGVAFRYRCCPDKWLDPYFALKVGPEYSQLASFISTFKLYENKWGFYISPEIGSNFWLTQGKNIGIHLALYYSFSTNKGAVLDGSVDKLNNFGFRVGLAF